MTEENKEGELNLQPLNDLNLPAELSESVATHHPKIGHTKIDSRQFVRCMKTANREVGLVPGVCSLTTDSPFGFGTIHAGAKVSVSMALSCDIGTNEAPISALGGLARGENPASLDRQTYDRLKTAFDALKDRSPDDITQYERVVFFEDAEREVQITPVVSLKMVHEFNRRIKGRREASKELKKENPSAKPPRVPYASFPVGGANPQNVGYVVNTSKFSNTVRGSIPLLAVRCPEDTRSGEVKLWGRFRASGSYTNVAKVSRNDLVFYGKRSIANIDLATNRNAEERHAREIADQFVAAREELVRYAASRQPLNEIDPWKKAKGVMLDEICWIDPRVGTHNRKRLAESFAQAVRKRVEAVLKRHAKDEGESQPFIMSDRSFSNLVAAFEEIL